MYLSRFAKPLFAVTSAVAIVAIAYWSRDLWRPANKPPASGENVSVVSASNVGAGKIIVGEQAQKNLEITATPIRVESFWKTVSVPGMVVDRPGVSDQEIVAPAVGTISRILHFPGDTVRKGDALFTFKLLGDSVNQAEAELYKASKATALAEAQRQRLVAAGQAIAQARVVEVENEIKRLQVSIESYRFELQRHGLSNADIEGVADGKFVDEIPIVVPPQTDGHNSSGINVVGATGSASPDVVPPTFEVQKLVVGTGQQVQAGESLCILSNHESLAIEGRAFRDETTLLERSLKEGWPVKVDFQEESSADWPPIETALPIRHISNTIDPATRSFVFLMPLQNQAKAVNRDGKSQLIWRFRPGQKVRLAVRVDQLDNVFVLHADAVAREGPEAYVFTQNVNTFERKNVHVLYQDRDHVVIANDGTFPTYAKNNERLTVSAVVRGAAAQLNRMTKSGPTAVPKGYHIHADGSLHKNEDEGK
jgi:multidrug efflux pump subunit AcrA (membrane-fusion protein)